ncbi:MAG: hypothetical protein U5K73_04680 [Halofilum sp. (in: g-proteobacteria)]|nr:hypothetical protein [Halofilum sp. (in: g-proteobacteria)]
MRERALQTWEIAQLIRRLQASAPDRLTSLRSDSKFSFLLDDALKWAESGDPVRAVLDLSAAAAEIENGPPDAAEAREMADAILRAADWPRPLRIQYLSDLHASLPVDLTIPDTGADVW